MLRTALVALLVGAVLSACGIRIQEYEFEDDHVVAEGITSVRAITGSGNVTIRHQPGLTETKIHRKVEHAKDNKPTQVSHRVEGSSLVLDGCGNNCEVNYTIAVPSATTTLVGDIGSGDLEVEGLASVDFITGSGRVVVRDVAGDVKVKTGSGDFQATRVGGTVTANLGSGNIDLDAIKGKTLVNTSSGRINGTSLESEVVADADSGDVELTLAAAKSVTVDTGSGEVIVRLPGGPYKVSGESGSGERSIGVRTDPASQLELKLTTGSGDVRVLQV
ncbi:hypothetical protein BBK82_15425 [Lentzea guizhouensis]|uniref:DUF4097 domain-containing protein n=1 Tax=Lentzea guizhouensis TaxID=1586287 RepID=A0A1B2HHQ9_9PSEU|nr:DUF4097 family beta strand repeat-containing protein [Lentzea guizhouensis]ANZ37246.1 hypothetical protein BBK82_15425 [Lentzea guizhouensis]